MAIHPMTTDEGHAMHAALETLRVARENYEAAVSRIEAIVAGAKDRLKMPANAVLDLGSMKRREWTTVGAVAPALSSSAVQPMRSVVP